MTTTQRVQRPYFQSCWVRARSQLGTRYKGKQLKISFLAGNELVPDRLKIRPQSVSRIKIAKRDNFFRLDFDIFKSNTVYRGICGSNPEIEPPSQN